MTTLPAEFAEWVTHSADSIDAGTQSANDILPRLAAAGFPGAGVPVASGGAGGNLVDAILAIAAVAQESLTAAFVLWGHRTYIEYLLQSQNRQLSEHYLPDLLAGRVAGATGLSNAMKFLAGLEPLQITAQASGEALVLDGKLHWVTNLRPTGFHVAAAVDNANGEPAFVVSLSHDDEGLIRSPDLELIAMRSSDTAAISLANVRVSKDRVLAENAAEWIPRVRPAFVGLQCGMSIGLAHRALAEAEMAAGAVRGVVKQSVFELQRHLDHVQASLVAGLRSGAFEVDPASLFKLRIQLAGIVADAILLELQATGGRAYLSASGRAFARRWREAAFIPVVTPSLVQLKTALEDERKAAA